MHTIHATGRWIRSNTELMFWVSAVIALYFLPVNTAKTTLCLFSLLGFEHCPGCGIGRSIHDALHLRLTASFRLHPLGIFAVLIIFNRIRQLIQPLKHSYETQSH